MAVAKWKAGKVTMDTEEENWPTACRAEFRRLAREDPQKLLSWVRSNRLSYVHLSFALESLGHSGLKEAIPLLVLDALTPRDNLVQEGAIYGLAPHLQVTLGELLRLFAETAPPALRATVQDILPPEGDAP